MNFDEEKRPRIRAAVAVLQNDKLLLVEHTKNDRSYWLLPGGGLDWGEGLRQAAAREVAEETGLLVQVGDLLLVSETLSPDGERHVVHMVFAGTLLGGEIGVPLDEHRITNVSWHSLDRVGDLALHPPMQEALTRIDLNELSKQTKNNIFLGNLWVD